MIKSPTTGPKAVEFPFDFFDAVVLPDVTDTLSEICDRGLANEMSPPIGLAMPLDEGDLPTDSDTRIDPLLGEAGGEESNELRL